MFPPDHSRFGFCLFFFGLLRRFGLFGLFAAFIAFAAFAVFFGLAGRFFLPVFVLRFGVVGWKMAVFGIYAATVCTIAAVYAALGKASPSGACRSGLSRGRC